jgi:hypothetical protein
MGDEEEVTPKGHDVHVELEVTLKDLYLGHQFKVAICHTTHGMMTRNACENVLLRSGHFLGEI